MIKWKDIPENYKKGIAEMVHISENALELSTEGGNRYRIHARTSLDDNETRITAYYEKQFEIEPGIKVFVGVHDRSVVIANNVDDCLIKAIPGVFIKGK